MPHQDMHKIQFFGDYILDNFPLTILLCKNDLSHCNNERWVQYLPLVLDTHNILSSQIYTFLPKLYLANQLCNGDFYHHNIDIMEQSHLPDKYIYNILFFQKNILDYYTQILPYNKNDLQYHYDNIDKMEFHDLAFLMYCLIYNYYMLIAALFSWLDL